MNLRLFSIALLMSVLPLAASAGSTSIALNEGDFISAERVSRDGETLVSVKLSKSGKAKFRRLSKVSDEIRVEVAGTKNDFKVRGPITGDGLEMGPYSESEAIKVVSEINQ